MKFLACDFVSALVMSLIMGKLIYWLVLCPWLRCLDISCCVFVLLLCMVKMQFTISFSFSLLSHVFVFLFLIMHFFLFYVSILQFPVLWPLLWTLIMITGSHITIILPSCLASGIVVCISLLAKAVYKKNWNIIPDY